MSTPSICDENNQRAPLVDRLNDYARLGSVLPDQGQSKRTGDLGQATKGDSFPPYSPSKSSYDQDVSPSGGLYVQREEEATEDEIPYPQRSTDELIHPPDFKPLFTLIEDPETSEHHHPIVHYIFSDDDPQILTNATLSALQAHDELSASGARSEEPEERYVILDMDSSGKAVASASSLNSQWQALKTTVTQAPSWGDAGNETDGKLLLKISGQEIRSSVKVRSMQQQNKPEESLEELVKVFGYRLDGLDQVMDGPEKDSTEIKTT